MLGALALGSGAARVDAGAGVEALVADDVGPSFVLATLGAGARGVAGGDTAGVGPAVGALGRAASIDGSASIAALALDGAPIARPSVRESADAPVSRDHSR